jgi:aminoglycoside phosphotransferase (APT) family kinase protein
MELHSNTESKNIDVVNNIFRDRLNIHPHSITLLPKGHWSFVYKVVAQSNTFVIKIQNGKIDGLKMEANLMNKLSAIGVQTPKPIIFGYSAETDKSYLIMSHIEGDLLRSMWRTFSKNKKIDLCEQLVEILISMQSVSVNGCGRLSSKLHGEFSTLEEYTESHLKSFFSVSQSIDSNVFSWRYFSRKILDIAGSIGNEPITFVHADFRMQNLIYSKENGITVIDFGNALAMLPSFDFFRFIRLDQGPDLLSDSEIDTLEVLYQKANPLYEQQKAFVRALVAMQLAPFSLGQGRVEAVKSFLYDLTNL